MWNRLSIIVALIIAISTLKDVIEGLRLVEVRIPNYVIKGSSAQLECLYNLDGEALYSVKWYKDGNEFYRYVPRDMPPAQTFLLPGVSVDLHNSSDAIVTLRNVNLQSAGRFRCEVSGEAPSFQTVTEHGDMVVVSLPDGPPKITGGRPRYQISDWVRINCTAGRSKPAVQLSWFVNGEPADPQHVRKYDTIISGREGLEMSVLGLQFRVEQHHFRNGDMKLKCVAALSTFYWRSNEESVEGDRPQKAPVLESRETVYASNSRADPVQASKTDSLVVAHAPSALLLLALATAATLVGSCGYGHGSGVDNDDDDGDGNEEDCQLVAKQRATKRVATSAQSVKAKKAKTMAKPSELKVHVDEVQDKLIDCENVAINAQNEMSNNLLHSQKSLCNTQSTNLFASLPVMSVSLCCATAVANTELANTNDKFNQKPQMLLASR